MDKIYAVSLEAQEELITKFCFGSCCKICIGGINIAGGPFLPCNTKDCPHEEAVLDDNIEIELENETQNVIIRKLKE